MLSSHRPRVRLVLAAAVAATVAPLATSPAAADVAPSDYADASISTATVTVPMTFPVIGPVSYSDTFLACRSGCARKHFGQDLMGPKMNIAVAAFNGVIHSIERETTVGGGNYLTLKGDNGWSANYIHMNNDTPGTDDGRGTANYFTAPGIREGKRVFAGELLGWVGDSGNAEGTGPHLHFELRKGEPWSGVVYNAFSSLNHARRLSKPTTSGPHPNGVYVKGCATTCSIWQLDAGQRRLLRPEVAKELAFDPRVVVPITQNEARWYRQGPDVQLPGGRAYRGSDTTKTWLVTGGKRYLVPDAEALKTLGIAAARVRTTTDTALRTVPVAATGSALPATVVYNGALLRVPGSTTSYWYVTGGVRRLVSDTFTLTSHGLVAADAITLPADLTTVVLPPLSTPLLIKDGPVIKAATGQRFLVAGGTRHPFHSWKAYVQYGYEKVLQQTPPGAAVSRLPVGARLP